MTAVTVVFIASGSILAIVALLGCADLVIDLWRDGQWAILAIIAVVAVFIVSGILYGGLS